MRGVSESFGGLDRKIKRRDRGRWGEVGGGGEKDRVRRRGRERETIDVLNVRLGTKVSLGERKLGESLVSPCGHFRQRSRLRLAVDVPLELYTSLVSLTRSHTRTCIRTHTHISEYCAWSIVHGLGLKAHVCTMD